MVELRGESGRFSDEKTDSEDEVPFWFIPDDFVDDQADDGGSETASEPAEELEEIEGPTPQADVYICQKQLRLRAGCTLQSQVVGRLAQGTRVRVVMCQELPSGAIRAKVIAGSTKGWVTMETKNVVLLKPVTSSSSSPDEAEKSKPDKRPTHGLSESIMERIAAMKAPKALVRTGGPKDLLGTDDICCNIAGPILFTAANGQTTTRVFASGRSRQQAAQLHTTELAIRCANAMGNMTGVGGSFCVWNPMGSFDGGNYDPNYLAPKNFEDSPFHNFLHRFIKENPGAPLLHVDLMGKKNRKGKNGLTVDVDVGTGPLQEEWDDTVDAYGLVQGIQKQIQAQLTKGLDAGGFKTPPFKKSKIERPYGVEIEPTLDGFWGSDVYTIANQAVCLGIPAFHLKMPDYFRAHLLRDVKLFGLFAETLANVYKNVIVPWWAVHSKVLKSKIVYNSVFSEKVRPRELTPEQCVSLREVISATRKWVGGF